MTKTIEQISNEANKAIADADAILKFNPSRPNAARPVTKPPMGGRTHSVSVIIADGVRDILAKKEAANHLEAQGLFFRRNPELARQYVDGN